MKKGQNSWKREKRLRKKAKKEIKNSEKKLATKESLEKIWEDHEKEEKQRIKLERKQKEPQSLEINELPKGNCKSESKKHNWQIHHESEDKTEIIYYCYYCHEHIVLDKKFNYYTPTLLPHKLKRKGPSESHPDARKYTAPEKAKSWTGDVVQKNEIYKRCLKNGKIPNPSEIAGLEEKSKIIQKIIPTIILDECVVSSKLIEKIQEQGYDGHYLGRRLDDDEIFSVVEDLQAILVTEDKEFHNRVLEHKFTLDPIFIGRNTEQVMENLQVIINHMRKFELSK